MRTLENANRPKNRRFKIILIVFLFLPCFFPTSATPEQYNPDQVWSELLEKNPFPYQIPLAESIPTPIDQQFSVKENRAAMKE